LEYEKGDKMIPSYYEFLNSVKIISGLKALENIPSELKNLGAKRPMLLTNDFLEKIGLVKTVFDAFGESDIVIGAMYDAIPPDSSIKIVNDVSEVYRKNNCDSIIAVGGGSVIDTAKGLSVVITENTDDLIKYMGAEVLSKKRAMPFIVVPTTAGTGSEVTYNAIVLVPEEELKIGIVSPKMMASYVIIDPMMTLKLPKAITAATGMDAMAHAIECYISKKANPFSDTFALKAVNLIAKSLRTAYNDGENVAARHDMLLGAMLAGICIATSSTTAVHALAYPLGGKYRIPHGLSNAILLPHVMKFTMDAAEEKFRDIAVAMDLPVTGLSAREAAEKMIENLYSLNHDLNIQVNLAEKGITENDIDFMADAALKVTRLLNNNPKALDKDDIREIYKKLFYR
jgi:alcohol dehydrogenase class IV